MIQILSIINPIWTFLFSFTLIMVYRLLIRPYLGILYYKKQGATTVFHRELIPYIKSCKNLAERDDFYYLYKEIRRKEPNTKFTAENFGSSVQLVLYDTDMIKDFLRKYEVYHKDKDITGFLEYMAQGTLAFSEDNTWKMKRKAISSAFNFEFLKHSIPMIVETVQEKFEEMVKTDSLVGQNLVDKLANITGEVTGKFVFGKRFGKHEVKGVPVAVAMEQLLIKASDEGVTLSTALFGTKLFKQNILPRHRQLHQDIADMKGVCRQIIKETKEGRVKGNCLIDLLFELRENGNSETSFSDDYIIGEFIALFAAGTDTTSHLVGSAIYFLSKYPEIHQKVKAEADKELSDLDNLTIEDLNRMNYTTAVLKETFRLGGPVGCNFTRIAMKDDDLCGLKVKKGTKVTYYNDTFYRSEKCYSNANEFIPERWLDDEKYNDDLFKKDPYVYLPFSSGPRNCIGQHLAMIEARILIGLFVKTFDFKFPEEYKLVLKQTFTFQPREPLMVTMTKNE